MGNAVGGGSTPPPSNAMVCPGCSPTRVRLRIGTGAHSVLCPRGHQFKLCVDPNDRKSQWLEVVSSPTPACKPGQRFRVPQDAVIS
jgi:hypothetical protein